MKIAIVVPKYTNQKYGFYSFPLGLGYISSTLKAAGHQVTCINANHTEEATTSLVERTIRENGIQACLTGALSPFLPQVREVFDSARRANPDIFNVAGGGVLSSDPEAMPGLLDIQAGVIGEGEVTVVDLMDAFETGRDLNTVNGIVFPGKNGEVIRTENRESISPADLGKLPWPDYEGFGYGEMIDRQRANDIYIFHHSDRPRSVEMISSRSCPYRCTFCFHPTGKIYRERPLDDFFAELDQLVKLYSINTLVIVDELFSLKKARLFEFCERIKPYNLKWIVQLHVNVADAPVLKAMHDAGCTYISYGVESMSPPVLLSMQKGSKVERIDAVMKYTYDNHIGIQGNLIFGDTVETLETANESMSWWAHHREYQINLIRLEVYPGSPDYIEAVRDGLITNRSKFIDELDIKLNISKMSTEDLRMIELFAGTALKSLLTFASNVTYDEDYDDVRDRLTYRIGWDCPRCEHHNDFRNIDMSPYPLRRTVRLPCRNCHARFDIKNPTRKEMHERAEYAAEQAAYTAALAELEAGREEAGVTALAELGKRSPWFHPALTALGRHHVAKADAAIAAGGYSVKDEMEAVINFGWAVIETPFEPQLHIDFAKAMKRKGAYGMARLHLEQVLHLDAEHAEARAELEALRTADVDPKAHEIYFPSFSNAPAPVRFQPDGYNRPKREKEFPDIAAIEREVRERLVAAGAR